VTTSLAESAQNAFEEFKTKYPENQHIDKIQETGMVAKSTNNHCALGIYFLQQSKGSSNS
jgi:hypothetical protein